jgi:hypothetical protein
VQEARALGGSHNIMTAASCYITHNQHSMTLCSMHSHWAAALRSLTAALHYAQAAQHFDSQFFCLPCRYLVQEARALGSSLEIIDRCNLTVLCEPGQEDLPQFLADNR